MAQGLMDQNSETRDFRLGDESDQRDVVDMELERQIDSVNFTQVPTARPHTQSVDLVSSNTGQDGQETRYPFVNMGLQDGSENIDSTRPRRVSKPTAKLIENRMQSDALKLDRIWEKTAQAISRLQGVSDSVGELRKAVGDLRSMFSDYQLVWVELMVYTAHASAPEQRQERQMMEEMMRTRKEIVQTAINEGIERKNDLLRELGSLRSGSRGSKTSVSSNAIRAQAKGEAAAALKKAEMQRKIAEFQSRSALVMELEERKRREEELAFERKKREEEACLEALRAEQEAAVALARTKAIEEELGFSQEYEPPDVPTERPAQRVQEFIDREFEDLKPQDHSHIPERETFNFIAPSLPTKAVKEEKPNLSALDPRAPRFTPRETISASNAPDHMDCFLQFMARRELIANRIEKFDNRPENFNTWKAAFNI